MRDDEQGFPAVKKFLVLPGLLWKSIHHRGTEFAEFGVFFNQELFTLCPESILSTVEGRLRSSAGSLRPEPVEGRGAIFWLVFVLVGLLGQLHFAGEAVAQVRETKHVEAQKLPASQVTLPSSRLHGVKSDPSNSFKLYSSTEKGLVVSDNGGHSWQPIAIGGRHEEIFALTLHPGSPDTLYVGRRDGLWRSQDAGKSWDRLP